MSVTSSDAMVIQTTWLVRRSSGSRKVTSAKFSGATPLLIWATMFSILFVTVTLLRNTVRFKTMLEAFIYSRFVSGTGLRPDIAVYLSMSLPLTLFTLVRSSNCITWRSSLLYTFDQCCWTVGDTKKLWPPKVNCLTSRVTLVLQRSHHECLTDSHGLRVDNSQAVSRRRAALGGVNHRPAIETF